MRRTGLLVIVAALLAPTAGFADEEPPGAQAAASARQAAADLRKAWQEKDVDQFRKLALRRRPDPFRVVWRLLRRDAVREKEGPISQELRALLAAYADVTAKAGPIPAVSKVARAWTEPTDEMLARERRLHVAYRRFYRNVRKDREKAIKVLDAFTPGDLMGPHSIAGPWLRGHRALLLSDLKRTEEAQAEARPVLELARTRAWPSLEALAWSAIWHSDLTRERWEAALPGARAEAAAAVRAGERGREAAALANVARLSWWLGNPIRAEAAARRSLEMKHPLMPKDTALDLRVIVAQSRGMLGAREPALTELADIAREARAAQLPKLELSARCQRVLVLQDLGRLADAVTEVEETIGFARGLADPVALAGAHATAGSVLERAGQLATAADHHREAVRAYERTNARRATAFAWTSLGAVLERAGRADDAQRALEKGLALRRGSTDVSGLIDSLALLALLHAAEKRTEKADALVAEALERVKEPGVGLPRLAQVLDVRARVRRAAGDFDGAIEDLTRALAIREEFGQRGMRRYAGSKFHLGLALLDAGRPKEAIDQLRDASTWQLAASHGFGESEASGLRREVGSIAMAGIDAACQLQGNATDNTPATASAWWFREAGQALMLADAIVNVRSLLHAALPDTLLEDERTALAGVERAQRGLAAVRSGPDASAGKTRTARKALATAHEQLKGVRASMQRAARREAQLAMPEPLELDAFRKRLDAGTVALSYAWTKSRVALLVVRRDDARLLDLGPPKGIAERVGAWLDLAATPGGAEADLAQSLYDALVRPAEPWIGKDASLLIMPDGPLAYLPFEGLSRKAASKSERVLERWAVSYVPSGTVWAGLGETLGRRTPGRGVLALGDPVYPSEGTAVAHELPALLALQRSGARLDRLPASGDEARGVAALYPAKASVLLVREDASLEASTRHMQARGWRAMHFACHGWIDEKRPRLSGLVLADGQVLNVERLYRMNLRADLAVLSACETARGAFQLGEGVIGLTRGFFHAGVPRVVVSTWRVSDARSGALMQAFHRHLVEAKVSPSEALRLAKLEMVHAGGEGAHPYYWAPFVLWGLAR